MISLTTTVRIALGAIAVGKMRSALTMLGVIIGVAAVITMLAVGKGASNRITEQIASMGSNLIIVVPGASTAGGARMGFGSNPTLTLDDALAIARECPAVAFAAPELGGVAQVIYGNQNWSSGIRGTTNEYLAVRSWGLTEGRPFLDSELRGAAAVAIVGQTIVDNLFGPVGAVGKTVRIKRIPFTVVGVLEKKGQSLIGRDEDETILVPVTTAQTKLFQTAFPGMVRNIFVSARSFEDLPAAEAQIKALLRQRHRIGRGQDDDFTVRNITERMQAYAETSRVLALLLGAIASVSLVVGGIGIMNIMLVSVTERTREIGIRMALGAKTSDIRMQFLIEAVTLSVIGGLAGIALGVAASYALSAAMGWDVVISPGILALAFSFSAMVGLFFGYYPAHKASLLSPIDALRYE
jgi:putative ABC transport system permease protein